MGGHFLLQGIFPTQGSNPHLLHWQADSFTTEPPGKVGHCVFYELSTLILTTLLYVIIITPCHRWENCSIKTLDGESDRSLVFWLQVFLINPYAAYPILCPHLPLHLPVSHHWSPLNSADLNLHLLLGELGAFSSWFRFHRWQDNGRDNLPVPHFGVEIPWKQERTAWFVLFWWFEPWLDISQCFPYDITHNYLEQPLEL